MLSNRNFFFIFGELISLINFLGSKHAAHIGFGLLCVRSTTRNSFWLLVPIGSIPPSGNQLFQIRVLIIKNPHRFFPYASVNVDTWLAYHFPLLFFIFYFILSINLKSIRTFFLFCFILFCIFFG